MHESQQDVKLSIDASTQTLATVYRIDKFQRIALGKPNTKF